MNWEVTQQESGMKLLPFLQQKLASQALSAKAIKKLLDNKRCSVNGRCERFASFPLGLGDTVSLELDLSRASSPTPVFDPQRVLLEDDALLIYNKPSGVNSEDPRFLKSLKRDLPYLALAHRLDRDTSGVLVLVKTSGAEKKMRQAFEKHLIKKTYLAIVDGDPVRSYGRIENYLGEIRRTQGQVYWGVVPEEKGQIAITEWTCEQRGNNAALILCVPKTGRTHQIRVHLNSLGHPILGDFQYGKSFRCPYRPRFHLLHAETLILPHPTTGKMLSISAPLPEHFEAALKELFGEQP